MGMAGRIRARFGRKFTVGEPARAADGLSPLLAAAMAGGPPAALTYEMAMSIPAVRRGVSVISSLIASMQLQATRGGARIDRPFLDQPEAWCTYRNTIASTVRELIFYPRAWWYVTARDPQGYPSSVIHLETLYVQAQEQVESGEIIGIEATYKGRRIDETNLIRFDGPDEGLLAFGWTLLTALRLEETAASYADSDIPSGTLRNTSQKDLTRPEIEELLDEWEIMRRIRKTAYLNQSIEYRETQSRPVDLQLVEAREESALQASRMLNVAARYCNATSGDSGTYSNSMSERRELLDISLMPYMGAIEQRLSMSDRNGSPRGQSARFAMDAFLRGNPLERAQLYSTLIPIGVLTAQEARAIETLAPGATEIP